MTDLIQNDSYSSEFVRDDPLRETSNRFLQEIHVKQLPLIICSSAIFLLMYYKESYFKHITDVPNESFVFTYH